jgi:V8-like Glu-specific endopeptidase
MRPPLHLAIKFGLAIGNLALPTSSTALVFGKDDRQIVSSEPGSPFSPIGVVYGAPETAYSTAFLIDDCHALTVQHVFGATRSSVGRTITFAAGVSGPARRWRRARATVIADGGLERAKGDAYSIRRVDWALLRLSKCLGREFGHVTITSRMPKVDEEIAMAGYPIDSPLSRGLEMDPSCRIREKRSGVLLHDCAGLPGNSGSPLFRISEIKGTQRLEVFAIAAAGHAFNVPGANLLLPVTQYHSSYSNVALAICGIHQFASRDTQDPQGPIASGMNVLVIVP